MRAVFLLGFMTLAVLSWAQRPYVLMMEPPDALPKRISVAQQFRNAEERNDALQDLLSLLFSKGYLAASIDSLANNGDTLIAFLDLGRTYRWSKLNAGNVDPEILSTVRFKEKLFFNEELDPRQVASVFSSILAHCENHGYPFAQLRMDQSKFSDSGVEANLYLEKGPLTQIDSVIVRGDCRTAMAHLQNYIDIKPGDLYNESKLQKLDSRLRELPYIKVERPYYVVFGEEQTKLYLFLSDKKASQINGILGVLPDGETGKVTVTGDVQLKLKNALKRGELIDMNWRKLQTKTQNLRINFNYPYLFNTPFGTDLLFELYKRDTTFLELNAMIGGQYIMRGSDNFRVYYRIKNSNELGQGNSNTDAGLADVSLGLYGVGATLDRLDYKRNPRAGYSIAVDGAAGRKRVSNTEIIDELPVTTEDKSTQIDLQAKGAYFIPIGKKGALKFGGQGGWMINDDLYLNELYRIGGLHSLRGTDEESIFASFYGIGTVEYRFLYETNANFHLFFDMAYYENNSADNRISDNPIGFGAGTSFETKAGIFSLNYALGQQFDNPIKFNAGKVHFGFVSIF